MRFDVVQRLARAHQIENVEQATLEFAAIEFESSPTAEEKAEARAIASGRPNKPDLRLIHGDSDDPS